jgi:hypothetical protein
MTTPDQLVQPEGRYNLGSFVTTRRPDEFLTNISEAEHQIILGAEVSEAKSGRDLCLGISAAAFVGLIGLLATTDFDTAMHQARKAPFYWALALALLTATPLFAAVVYHLRYHRTRSNSPYSRLMQRIAEDFKRQKESR